METVLNKLQEGVKYPRFERDATRIINDLVSHITKERGVYSSSIEPNPNEHKVWFNTNTNTLNIYENGKWNTISGGGSGGGSTEYLSGVKTIGMNSGIITGVTGVNMTSGSISGVTKVDMISGIISGVNSITLVSGSNAHIVKAQGSIIAYNGVLADTTLFHSINFNNGDIKGVNSIKSHSSGLTIEPADILSTGQKIVINGRAAGLSVGANSNAPFTLDGISSLNWKNGSSNGYMMTFNVNNNTINSNYDKYNINYATIQLSSSTISGSISASGLTINHPTLYSATLQNVNITSGSINVSGVSINNATINGGNLSGSISASGATINGVTITGNINANGATINRATISGGIINGPLISDCYIEKAYINTTGGQLNNTYFTNGFINGNITISGVLNGGTISGATISGATLTGSISASGASIENVTLNNVNITSGKIGDSSSQFNICGVILTGGDFQKLKNM